MTNNIITITDHSLIIEPQGLDKVWTFKDRLEIPLSHVMGATFDPGIAEEPKGMRGPGLGMPKKFAGTFTNRGDKSFWNVSGFDRTIVIQLTDEHYERLVLTADDPKVTVDRINASVQV
jgi:hypothetical protein